MNRHNPAEMGRSTDNGQCIVGGPMLDMGGLPRQVPVGPVPRRVRTAYRSAYGERVNVARSGGATWIGILATVLALVALPFTQPPREPIEGPWEFPVSL